jgi:general secretion pathway protein F
VAVSRFCRTLGTLLVSGVPILTALAIVKTVVGNDVIALAVEGAGKNIAEGQSIAVPLKQSGEFPPIVTHMITIGEKTGELEGMLTKVADAYDAEVENTVNSLTSLLTPILTIFMGLVVATIALGILLPMLQLASAVR